MECFPTPVKRPPHLGKGIMFIPMDMAATFGLGLIARGANSEHPDGGISVPVCKCV